MRTSMISVFGAAMLLACGSDHPPGADFAGQVAPPALITEAGAGEPTPDGGPLVEAEDCPPRSKRECMTAFLSIGGKVQACTQSVQWCRADGKGWHKCGFSVDKPPD